MIQRGRKSTAALAVVTPITITKRLAPPEHLPADQQKIWQETVDAMPADWFGPEHLPMLESYCRHIAFGRTIGKALAQVPPEWLLDEEGLKRHDRLYAMHEREGRAASSLATRMRLTQQAVIDKRVAGHKGQTHKPRARKPWDPPEDES
jgi:hypothetical protein